MKQQLVCLQKLLCEIHMRIGMDITHSVTRRPIRWNRYRKERNIFGLHDR